MKDYPGRIFSGDTSRMIIFNPGRFSGAIIILEKVQGNLLRSCMYISPKIISAPSQDIFLN